MCKIPNDGVPPVRDRLFDTEAPPWPNRETARLPRATRLQDDKIVFSVSTPCQIARAQSGTLTYVKGTSNNCHRSSGTSNLLANDSALFSFRFCAVHPKDVRDCQLRQLFEVPIRHF